MSAHSPLCWESTCSPRPSHTCPDNHWGPESSWGWPSPLLLSWSHSGRAASPCGFLSEALFSICTETLLVDRKGELSVMLIPEEGQLSHFLNRDIFTGPAGEQRIIFYCLEHMLLQHREESKCLRFIEGQWDNIGLQKCSLITKSYAKRKCLFLMPFQVCACKNTKSKFMDLFNKYQQ